MGVFMQIRNQGYAVFQHQKVKNQLICIVLNLASFFSVRISVYKPMQCLVNETQCLVFATQWRWPVYGDVCQKHAYIFSITLNEKAPKKLLIFPLLWKSPSRDVPCACNCETFMNPLMEPATSILKAWFISQMAPAEKLCRWIFPFFVMPGVCDFECLCRVSWWLVFHFIVVTEEQIPLMPQVSLCIEFYCIRPYSNGILGEYGQCIFPVYFQSSVVHSAVPHYTQGRGGGRSGGGALPGGGAWGGGGREAEGDGGRDVGGEK